MPPVTRPHVAALLAALACSSCSSEGLNPVAGTVLVNGQPAVGATVMFFPEGAKGMNVVPSTGVVGADGTFTLSTGGKTGAPAGRYVVAVTWPDPKVKVSEQQKMMGMAPDAPDVLKGRYAGEKSKLKAEVKSGANKLDPFQLQ
ncbi:MAG TPA: hypothetical protein VFG68_11980 [Fimbriiglobus sp.]|nr:hypothetical protein [Fimbriiglobus sp.]